MASGLGVKLRRFTLIVLAALLSTGCQLTSKYALDDADYAEKYDVPYDDGKILRMGKQMVDARHVKGKSGFSAGIGGANTGGGALAGDLTLFGYPESWIEVRAGLQGVVSGDANDTFGGGHLGWRFQTPSRLAPFAGFGGFVGAADEERDEICGCVREKGGAFASIYPEVGAHFWLTGRSRLSFSSQYWFNTQGRAADFWLHTISFAILSE